MAATQSTLPSKLIQSAHQWWRRHRHESNHCTECDEPIGSFDKVCPNCGQGNPARVSPWLAVYLFVCVAMIFMMYSAFKTLLS